MVTAAVGRVHGSAGKLTITADVEEVAGSASTLHKVTASSSAVHPDTTDAQPGEEQEVFALALL